MRAILRAVCAAAGLAGLAAITACGSTPNSVFSDGGADSGHSGGPRDGSLHDTGKLGQDVKVLSMMDTSVPAGTLAITPQNPTLAVTNGTIPTEAFTAKVTMNGSTEAVSASWDLSSFSLGTITSGGAFTPGGTVAGTITVTATYGVLTAKTNVTVTVDLSSNLGDVTLPDGTVISEDSSAITPADLTALQAVSTAGDGGTAEPDGSTPSTLIYPYDGTVFPLGLLAPVAEFSAGSVAPVDFKVSLDTTGYHWDGFGHVGNPTALQAAIPQSAWDGALESATSSTPASLVTLSVTKAAAGVAYGPARSRLTVANGKLTGVIYFESYSTDPIDAGADAAPGASDFGLWAVKPGQSAPPSHLQPGCVICHGVSASGNTLTSGTDDPTVGQLTGVYRVEADGGYTHLATAPPGLPYTANDPTDSRGLGWGTVSPDGKVILRGENQFWGGEALLAWAVPGEPLLADGGVAPLTTSMTVAGNLNMFVPQYSVDGKHLVYVTATNADAGGAGAVTQSIGEVDVATTLTDGGADGGFGTVALTSPRTLYDSTQVDGGGSQAWTKVPTFLPDSQSVVFEETHQSYAGYDHMLPDYDGQSTVQMPGVDGELAILQPNGSGGYVRAPLTSANAGYDPASPTVNYEPKPLPVQVGGYYWVVFASRRQDAYPQVTAPKKLWVTAISPNGAAGVDPSHPPFTLINQAIVAPQASQRAYWALAPCLGQGAGCQTNNDCCNGSCIPMSSTDPTSPLECLPPPTMPTCAAIGGRCAAGQDQACCGASQGVQCIGTLNGYGTCSQPGPPR